MRLADALGNALGNALGAPVLTASGPPPLTRRLLLGLLGATLAGVMSLMNTRLTSFGISDLRGAVGLDMVLGGWVTAAFNVGTVVILPGIAVLAGMLSARRLLVICMWVLTFSSLGLATVPTYYGLVLLRFLQGAASGALLPLLLVSVLTVTPLAQRVWGFGVYAAITTLSPAVAESIAGWITDFASWKLIFWQNLILAPVATVLILVGFPPAPVRLAHLDNVDVFALIYSAVGVGALTAALTQGQLYDWFDSGIIVGLFVTAAICLTAFVVNELTCAKPLIDVRLLRHANFSLGLCVLLAFSFALLGAYYVLPQFAATVKGWRELQIGQVLIWLALPQLLLTPLSCWLLRHVDARLVLAAGLATFATGAIMATYVTADWAVADLLPSQLVQACAFPFIMPPLIVIVTSSLAPADAASGGALFNMVRVLAGTVGSAVTGAVITVRERVHSAAITAIVPPGSVAPGGVAGAAARASTQAYVMAYADAFGMLALVAFACLLLVPLFRATPVARPGRRSVP
jgi:DHA2 family multidrug resistance protein